MIDFGTKFLKERVLYPRKCDMVMEAMCNANFAHFVLYIPADYELRMLQFCNRRLCIIMLLNYIYCQSTV